MSVQFAVPLGLITEPVSSSALARSKVQSHEITQDGRALRRCIHKCVCADRVRVLGGYRGCPLFKDFILCPEAKMVSLGAVFMSVSRPPDGAARPQRFNNHK